MKFNKSLILSIMIVSSTPFTNTLGNGQIGLFLLMSLVVYWYSNSKIKGIYLLKPDIYKDNRGFFFESYNCKKLQKVIKQYL